CRCSTRCSDDGFALSGRPGSGRDSGCAFGYPAQPIRRRGVVELAFPWPISQGEWLAWSSAAATALFGLLMLLAPRSVLRLIRLQPAPERPEAVGEVRATMGGFYLGAGL